MGYNLTQRFIKATSFRLVSRQNIVRRIPLTPTIDPPGGNELRSVDVTVLAQEAARTREFEPADSVVVELEKLVIIQHVLEG